MSLCDLSKSIEARFPVSQVRYCAHCNGEVDGESVCQTMGWCAQCRDTVNVRRCGVSYWTIAVVMALSWAQPFSDWPC